MSLPANRMRPESDTSCPLSCAIRVVFPAPFGPMTACSSPSGILRLSASVAIMPPKRLPRLFTCSKSAMTHLAKQSVDAPAGEQHYQQQQWTKYDLPVFGDAGEHLFQHQQRHRAEQRAKGRTHAAEHDHDDEIARAGPIHHRGADKIGVIGE